MSPLPVWAVRVYFVVVAVFFLIHEFLFPLDWAG